MASAKPKLTEKGRRKRMRTILLATPKLRNSVAVIVSTEDRRKGVFFFSGISFDEFALFRQRG
jgi:hypothetical protein